MRYPHEPARLLADASLLAAQPAAAALGPWLLLMRRRLRRAGVLHNDQLFGIGHSGAIDEARLIERTARAAARAHRDLPASGHAFRRGRSVLDVRLSACRGTGGAAESARARAARRSRTRRAAAIATGCGCRPADRPHEIGGAVPRGAVRYGCELPGAALIVTFVTSFSAAVAAPAVIGSPQHRSLLARFFLDSYVEYCAGSHPVARARCSGAATPDRAAVLAGGRGHRERHLQHGRRGRGARSRIRGCARPSSCRASRRAATPGCCWR